MPTKCIISYAVGKESKYYEIPPPCVSGFKPKRQAPCDLYYPGQCIPHKVAIERAQQLLLLEIDYGGKAFCLQRDTQNACNLNCPIEEETQPSPISQSHAAQDF